LTLHLLTLIVPVETERQRMAANLLRVNLAPLGYSEYDGRGVWKGLAERHVRIEVFTEDAAVVRAHHYRYGQAAREHTLARIVDGVPELVKVTPPPPTWPPVSSESEHRARHDNISRRTRG